MKRRTFLQRAVPVATLPFLINGLPLNAYGRSPWLESLVDAAAATDRVLVLVQLGGGNDGINTVIPRDQYGAYMSSRINIAIPENLVLPVTTATGFHPTMTGMKEMFDNGKLAVVQGVTYPNPDLSHFRATDIWLTAANFDQYLSTGWIGRYLDQEFSGYPHGYPNEVMPDPLAIQIGAVTSLALQGSAGSMGVSIQSPDAFYRLISGGNQGGEDTPPQTPAGRELGFIQEISLQAQEYAVTVKAASDAVADHVRSALYPSRGQNYLADQLEIVATLIAGGLKTRIYVVNLYGFDNHSSQVDQTDTTTGVHASLLKKLSDALAAFQDDLRMLGVEDRVLGMTFSEFGRRVHSNSSLGTDHGTAAPMFLFGSAVQAGIIGGNPSLTDLDDGNLKMQYDFRMVYASILNQWFGVDHTSAPAMLPGNFPTLDLVRSSYQKGGFWFVGHELHDNYPNPFNSDTVISYDLTLEEDVLLEVYDIAGRRIATLVNTRQPAGAHQVQFSGSRLPSGVYIYRLTTGSFVSRKKMVLVK